MGSPKKLHVGFPEKALDKYVATLVDQGYKVAVVEQTETPRQMELRLKREAAGKKYGGEGPSERLVNREICNVLTKGTFIDSKVRSEDACEPRYVLALKRSGNVLGVTFFDVSTLKFFVG